MYYYIRALVGIAHLIVGRLILIFREPCPPYDYLPILNSRILNSRILLPIPCSLFPVP
ncbi:hypothetical protein [Moorena producens]|uniref:hypothetical protein n=1 Tax=Moorena producens TaxID=1155739 RepID=UPI003C7587BD